MPHCLDSSEILPNALLVIVVTLHKCQWESHFAFPARIRSLWPLALLDIQGLVDRVRDGASIEVAVVDPRRIPDELVLLVAANKVVHLRTQDRLKTSSVHTELLYQLSPATNIAGALKMFGPSEMPSPAAIIVCAFDATSEQLETAAQLIGGSSVPEIEPWGPRADLSAICEAYKLRKGMDMAEIVDAAVTKIAIKQPS